MRYTISSPDPTVGAFLCSGQTVMFRMNGTPRAQGCAGAACFNLARRIQERYAASKNLIVINNPGLGVIKDIKVKLTLRFGHDGSNHGVTGDIHHRTGHIQ